MKKEDTHFSDPLFFNPIISNNEVIVKTFHIKILSGCLRLST